MNSLLCQHRLVQARQAGELACRLCLFETKAWLPHLQAALLMSSARSPRVCSCSAVLLLRPM